MENQQLTIYLLLYKMRPQLWHSLLQTNLFSQLSYESRQLGIISPTLADDNLSLLGWEFLLCGPLSSTSVGFDIDPE